MGEGKAEEIENEGEVLKGKLEIALTMDLPCRCGSASTDGHSSRVFPLRLVVALELEKTSLGFYKKSKIPG